MAAKSGKENEEFVAGLLGQLLYKGEQFTVTELAGSTAGADVKFTFTFDDEEYSMEVKSSGAFEFGQCALTCEKGPDGTYHLAYPKEKSGALTDKALFFRDIAGIDEKTLSACWGGHVPQFLEKKTRGVKWADAWLDVDEDNELKNKWDAKEDTWTYVPSEKWGKTKINSDGSVVPFFSDVNLKVASTDVIGKYYGQKSNYAQLMGYGTFATIAEDGSTNDPLGWGVPRLEVECSVRLRVKKGGSAYTVSSPNEKGYHGPASLNVFLAFNVKNKPHSEFDLADPDHLPHSVTLSDTVNPFSLAAPKAVASKPKAVASAASKPKAAAAAVVKSKPKGFKNDEDEADFKPIPVSDLPVGKKKIRSVAAVAQDDPSDIAESFMVEIKILEQECSRLEAVLPKRVSKVSEREIVDKDIKELKELLENIKTRSSTIASLRSMTARVDAINIIRDKIKDFKNKIATKRASLFGKKSKRSKKNKKSRRSKHNRSCRK